MNKPSTMVKIILVLLSAFPMLGSAQRDLRMLVDSLRYIQDMPYICEGSIPDNLGVGCGDIIYWQVVGQRENIIPFLIESLDDTTQIDVFVPNFGGYYTVADAAYTALGEIIKDIPTFKLLGVKFDKRGCGYCAYYKHLRKGLHQRKKFKKRVNNWYDKNKSNLVWVESNDFLSCDCRGVHPSGGYWVLKK